MWVDYGIMVDMGTLSYTKGARYQLHGRFPVTGFGLRTAQCLFARVLRFVEMLLHFGSCSESLTLPRVYECPFRGASSLIVACYLLCVSLFFKLCCLLCSYTEAELAELVK